MGPKRTMLVSSVFTLCSSMESLSCLAGVRHVHYAETTPTRRILRSAICMHSCACLNSLLLSVNGQKGTISETQLNQSPTSNNASLVAEPAVEFNSEGGRKFIVGIGRSDMMPKLKVGHFPKLSYFGAPVWSLRWSLDLHDQRKSFRIANLQEPKSYIRQASVSVKPLVLSCRGNLIKQKPPHASCWVQRGHTWSVIDRMRSACCSSCWSMASPTLHSLVYSALPPGNRVPAYWRRRRRASRKSDKVLIYCRRPSVPGSSSKHSRER